MYLSTKKKNRVTEVENKLVSKRGREGMNWETGIDIYILHCQSLSRVQLFATPWTAAHQAPLSMGILQARVLEWGAISFSKVLRSSLVFYFI